MILIAIVKNTQRSEIITHKMPRYGKECSNHLNNLKKMMGKLSLHSIVQKIEGICDGCLLPTKI